MAKREERKFVMSQSEAHELMKEVCPTVQKEAISLSRYRLSGKSELGPRKLCFWCNVYQKDVLPDKLPKERIVGKVIDLIVEVEAGQKGAQIRRSWANYASNVEMNETLVREGDVVIVKGGRVCRYEKIGDDAVLV